MLFIYSGLKCRARVCERPKLKAQRYSKPTDCWSTQSTNCPPEAFISGYITAVLTWSRDLWRWSGFPRCRWSSHVCAARPAESGHSLADRSCPGRSGSWETEERIRKRAWGESMHTWRHNLNLQERLLSQKQLCPHLVEKCGYLTAFMLIFM